MEKRITRVAGVEPQMPPGKPSRANEDFGGQFYLDGAAQRERVTYGVFLGLDQTNEAGLVGFIRAGYAFRDMGRMPCGGTVSDGVTTTQWSGSTTPMDFSGYFVQVGMGFDRLR